MMNLIKIQKNLLKTPKIYLKNTKEYHKGLKAPLKETLNSQKSVILIIKTLILKIKKKEEVYSSIYLLESFLECSKKSKMKKKIKFNSKIYYNYKNKIKIPFSTKTIHKLIPMMKNKFKDNPVLKNKKLLMKK
jgi:hypothetical protein